MMLLTILVYFVVLFGVSRWTSRRATNESFFRAERKSPWYMVAFGMVGASISGVTFVSVPGMVTSIGMAYLQTCLGFIVGYFVVAFLLLPLYYRLNLTSIYTYLGQRLGPRAYLTGAWFFLISKMSGAAVAFYVVCGLLENDLALHAPLSTLNAPLSTLHAPLSTLIAPLLTIGMVALIWFYTRRGGIKTLVWTDTVQTFCLLTALLLIIYKVTRELGITPAEAVQAVSDSSLSRIFVLDDWTSKQYFWKQFLSGIFIVIVMTGLDQDKMQKNLTCKTLREAQKDMTTYGFAFVPVNLLFLSLGVLLVLLAEARGVALPAAGDALLPMFAATGELGNAVVVLFTLGVVAASFSSADSAITSMTTSYCVDICQRTDDERLRKRVHLVMSVVFAVFIMAFRLLNSTSVIDAIYVLVSYTYGPLLGLFAFGLLTKKLPRDRWVPYIAVASPLICLAIDKTAAAAGYTFGYELLMLNGLLTFGMLWLTSLRYSHNSNL